ncbi:response regulator transcription factor [Vallitalea guaymasensis]|uniref:response regulator transcription factor n=1 Tax=Vallitalea guaymasensis TaxID=1185412 RepID=UPI002356C611|nr:response regulator transcription factor [Vallitalea guaymasensis]
MIKILIVEDERAISDLIEMSLSCEGYECTCAYDGRYAADILEKKNFDLVLLDIMLPYINGYEILEYSKTLSIPVIFLTAKDELEDKVKGLRAGAEDYITKPFEISELIARVETVLRRYDKADSIYQIDDISIDLNSMQVIKSGKNIQLTAKEFYVLVMFARNTNKALYRRQIYSQVWNEVYLGDSRTVDLHVQRVRKKLGLEDKIVSVYKVGYRLEV